MEQFYSEIIKLLQYEYCNHTLLYYHTRPTRGEFHMQITARNIDGANQVNILVVSAKSSEILYDTTIYDNGTVREYKTDKAPLRWIMYMLPEVKSVCWSASC